MTTDWLFKPISISRATLLLVAFIGLLFLVAISVWLWYDFHVTLLQSEIQTLQLQHQP